MKPTPEQLLEVARETGLRGFLHGVSATDARDLLGRFVEAVRVKFPGSRPELELAHGVHYTERKLVEGVLRNMKQQNLGRRRRPRWAVITQVFGVGSGVAHGICLEFGYDPEEMI